MVEFSVRADVEFWLREYNTGATVLPLRGHCFRGARGVARAAAT